MNSLKGAPWVLGDAYDIYYSTKQPDGSGGIPKNMGPGVNTNQSEMQSWVGIDGFTGKKVLYFVRYKQSGENYVYHSEFVHGRWTKAEKVLIGADKQPIGGEPSLTGDGKYLYIGVDAGGPDQWQLDIGFAERQADGSWDELQPVD